jgi:hypothetical protein
MKNKKEWETKSLELIHKVREEIDKEIRGQGVTPAQWIRARGKIDVEELCKKLGLKNYTIRIDSVDGRGYSEESPHRKREEVGHR